VYPETALTDLKKARDHAKAVLANIDKKQGELSNLEVVTAGGLTLAGTGAGAAGVFDASADIVTGFAVAAAGFLGISDLAQTAARNQILDAGEKAILCAVEQTRALEASNTISNRTQFAYTIGDSNSANGDKSIVSEIAEEYRSTFSEDRLSALSAEMKIQMYGAAALVGYLARSGQSLRDRVAFALDASKIDPKSLATVLTITVEGIRAEMEKQLRETLPDPEKIFRSQRERVGAIVKENRAATQNAKEEIKNNQSVINSALLATLGFSESNIVVEKFLIVEHEDHRKQITEIEQELESVADCLDEVRTGESD